MTASYQQCADVAVADSVLKNVESQLLLTHAQFISDLDKVIDDDPEHACCSCERLHQRNSVTRVKLSDNLGCKVWPALKAFIVEQTQMLMSKCCTYATTVSHSSRKTKCRHVVCSMDCK